LHFFRNDRYTVTTFHEVGERSAERMARFLGPGPMAGIEDEDVTGMAINPTDGVVRFETRSRGRIDSGERLASSQVLQFLNAAASHVGASLTPERPLLQAELPHARFRGARLQGFVPPVSSGPAFVIRKPASAIYSLDEYVERGILACGDRDVLREAVLERWNILVVGGTGSGKTTLVNSILREVTELCPVDRMVILEDTVELQCSAPDSLSLRTPEGGSLAELVKASLRADPTRIVVGEMRDAAALDWLDASSTGHPGSLATLHATTPEGALLRLERLARRGSDVSHRELIADAVDLLVMIRGKHAARRVTDLVRVRGLDDSGRYLLSPIGVPPCAPSQDS
jgi:P-type conjugative transfer ATPase TrbB